MWSQRVHINNTLSQLTLPSPQLSCPEHRCPPGVSTLPHCSPYTQIKWPLPRQICSWHGWYCWDINSLVFWFDSSYMDLNVTKTKQLCLGGNMRAGNTGSNPTYKPITARRARKWSRSLTSSTWQHSLTIDYVYKKRDSDLLFSGNYSASTRPAHPVQSLVVENVLMNNMASWWWHLSVQQIVNEASKITGHKQPQLQDLFTKPSNRTGIQIYNDPAHPLHSSFQLLPSGHRLKVPISRKNLKNSWILTAITTLNNTLFKLRAPPHTHTLSPHTFIHKHTSFKQDILTYFWTCATLSNILFRRVSVANCMGSWTKNSYICWQNRSFSFSFTHSFIHKGAKMSFQLKSFLFMSKRFPQWHLAKSN